MKYTTPLIGVLATLTLAMLTPYAQAQQTYQVMHANKLPNLDPVAWEWQHRIEVIKSKANNRLVKYGVEAASQLTNDSVLRTLDKSSETDPTRPTSFISAYDTKGWYLYIKSTDPNIAQAVANQQGQSLEIFFSPNSPSETGYFRIDVNIVTGKWYATNYNAMAQTAGPLQASLKVHNQVMNDGQAWGTVLFIPWEYFQDRLPLDGQSWSFTFMRWSPTGGTTWGGKVHELGAWGVFEWEKPAENVKQAIQASLIKSSWQKYQGQLAAARLYWLDMGNDPDFYTQKIQPLAQTYNEQEQTVKDVDKLDAGQVANLFANVNNWSRFDKHIVSLRGNYLQQKQIEKP